MDNVEALPALESRIAALVAQYAGIPDGMAVPRSCSSVMDAVASQGVTSSEGGKRLRARLALAAFDALRPKPDGDDEAWRGHRAAAADLACAIEVFQTAALVHDDIIDDSDLRRGKPSAHRALAAALGDDPQADHVGRGLGIMLGDLLATASVAIAHDAAAALPKTESIMRTFLRMHREVEIGQVLDLAVEEAPLDRPEALASSSLGVFRWKTASYTTIAPIELGLLAAGAKTAKAQAIAASIGTPLGLAFQLADDLIDVIGSSASTGKPVGGDIREGKRTVLLADALAGAGEADRAELIRMFEAPERDADDVARAITLFKSTGAIDRSRGRIATLWRTAASALDEAAGMLGLSPASRDLLLGACECFLPKDLRGC
ncbi:polyprenyl synthetase family protein [Bifidobacterium avesanii]|uniref:Polyprenyl synthetase family protein n=1 Tax=Bifidobacterium avesanii TaxID=1798157 RepID=A0A7K3TKV6_9BIFI|nr:polyprenyl synthetase family protein [Bifidobacterium avesanii]KAB8288526.1 serralysin [Bifidobacterium avesanii]NEG79250.1 polyprenyl synthetase family protein [Bifidobacterium avesanii]